MVMATLRTRPQLKNVLSCSEVNSTESIFSDGYWQLWSLVSIVWVGRARHSLCHHKKMRYV